MLTPPDDRCEQPELTLNLCLVHHKELVAPAALELFPVAAVKAHFLILQLVEGELGCREPTVTSISSQDRQRLLLKHRQRAGLRFRDSSICTYALVLEHRHPQPRPSHLLCAHVHTLVHRHVLDDCTDRKRQSDIVRPVETALEYGTPI